MMRYRRLATVVFAVTVLLVTTLLIKTSSRSGWTKQQEWVQPQQDTLMQPSRSLMESHAYEDSQAIQGREHATVESKSSAPVDSVTVPPITSTKLSDTQSGHSSETTGQSAVTVLNELTQVPKAAASSTTAATAVRADTSGTPSLGTTSHSTESNGSRVVSTKLKIFTKPRVISPTTSQAPGDGHSSSVEVDDAGAKGHGKDPITILGKVPENRPNLSAAKIFMSLKTSSVTEDKRFPPMLLTWMQTIEQRQMHIVTDAPSHWTEVAQALGFEITIADCRRDHKLSSLCCKSGKEYELYYAAKARGEDYSWYCHFDDDVYVNVPVLVDFLSNYSEKDKLYFGHYPVTLRRNKPVALRARALTVYPELKGKPYRYATGAAYCISMSLMEELKLYLRDSATYMETCSSKLFTTDDMVVGALIELFLGSKLTEVPAMQSHIEKLGKIDPSRLKDMITIGYSLDDSNVVTIPNSAFSIENDPQDSFHITACFMDQRVGVRELL